MLGVPAGALVKALPMIAAADRPDEARVGAEVPFDLVVVRELERRVEVVLQLDLVQPVVPSE